MTLTLTAIFEEVLVSVDAVSSHAVLAVFLLAEAFTPGFVERCEFLSPILWGLWSLAGNSRRGYEHH